MADSNNMTDSYYLEYTNINDIKYILGFYNNLELAKNDITKHTNNIKSIYPNEFKNNENNNEKMGDTLIIYKFNINNNMLHFLDKSLFDGSNKTFNGCEKIYEYYL